MKTVSIAVLTALVAAGTIQGSFEAADFKVMEALVEQGVNISAIPELADLTERSSTLACSIAVSST